MDIPPDIASGIAIGGAIVGGAAKVMFDKILGAKAKKQAGTSGAEIRRMVGELVQLQRVGVELQRESRDLLIEMAGDHRVLETKIDQVVERRHTQ